MDESFKAYLDAKFSHLESKIDDVKSTTATDMQHLRGDISDLYTKDREIRDRMGCAEGKLGTVEGRVKTLEDAKGQSNDDRRFVIMLVGLILTAALAIIGWLWGAA